jgi:hypothetical protein
VKIVAQKVFSWIIIGITMGIVTASLLLLSVDRPYIQQKAVMTLVKSGMSNPDVRDMLVSQVIIYLKSPEGTKEMVEYLKTPEVSHALAEQMETPEFRQHLLHLMQIPEVRKTFINSLKEVPEFKILKALGEFVPNQESVSSKEQTPGSTLNHSSPSSETAVLQ